MYYEIEGNGAPIVYVPPALAHAGMRSFPELSKTHSIIKVDLQGYGRTADIPARTMSIEQHGKDVVAVLKHLKISKTDFFGESFGGAIVTLIATRYPDLVGRVATYGATFGPPKDAIDSAMMRSERPPTPDSEAFEYQRENYREVAPDPTYWPKLWEKVVAMKWDGFSNEELALIKAPFLVALGDHDFVRLEHAVESFRRIPGADLAVIPDAGHFVMYSEPNRLNSVLTHFFDKPEMTSPIATAATGYRPGETR
jgi:pimeloyl-ACP methyl ester carboxylesterase